MMSTSTIHCQSPADCDGDHPVTPDHCQIGDCTDPADSIYLSIRNTAVLTCRIHASSFCVTVVEHKWRRYGGGEIGKRIIHPACDPSARRPIDSLPHDVNGERVRTADDCRACTLLDVTDEVDAVQVESGLTAWEQWEASR
jgi:hypothetical protein